MRYELKIRLNWLNALLALNLLIFILARLVSSIQASDRVYVDLVSYLGGFNFIDVYSGHLWLLITSGFLHFDIIHFLVNIYSLYRLGSIVNNFYSERILFTSYILGSLMGSIFTYIAGYLNIFVFESPYNVLSYGASSGIFALIGLLLGGTLRKSRFGASLPFTFQDILPIAVFSLFIGFIPGTNINNWAHLGGLVAGLLIGITLASSLGYKSKINKQLESILYWSSIILFVTSFFALIANFLFVIFRN